MGKLKITTAEWVERAKARHGLKYDYEPTVYRGTRMMVTTRCRTHGLFQQQANNHLAGHGCQQCANSDRAWHALMRSLKDE